MSCDNLAAHPHTGDHRRPVPFYPKKEVEEALSHSEGQGWRVEVGGNNARALRRVLGSASIWHLADVLTWLQAKGSYSLAKKGHRLPHSTSKELEALVG